MMYMIGKFEKNGSGSMQGMCSKNWNSRQRAPVLVTYLERFSPADAPSRVEENYFARKPKRTSGQSMDGENYILSRIRNKKRTKDQLRVEREKKSRKVIQYI